MLFCSPFSLLPFIDLLSALWRDEHRCLFFLENQEQMPLFAALTLPDLVFLPWEGCSLSSPLLSRQAEMRQTLAHSECTPSMVHGYQQRKDWNRELQDSWPEIPNRGFYLQFPSYNIAKAIVRSVPFWSCFSFLPWIPGWPFSETFWDLRIHRHFASSTTAPDGTRERVKSSVINTKKWVVNNFFSSLC